MRAILVDGPLRGHDGVDVDALSPSSTIFLADNIMTAREKLQFFAKLAEERMRIGDMPVVPGARKDYVASLLKKPTALHTYKLVGRVVDVSTPLYKFAGTRIMPIGGEDVSSN